MPLIQIHILEGRSSEDKENLIRDTSDLVAKTLKCPLSTFRVLIQELPKEHWGIAGESVKKKLET
ncbi:4-oxalocrotonate tautomerase family protein [Fictibacillus enclensis]|uniref:4-oxalocrotonate tautomerase family protein n=1 Tax=Fictibacillus enclensis TaxID=1017270 RepID=UPI0025A00ED9|nr:4-oxalocrotonate tautomerase family protein [Fictibacillus enclensis]MDM5196759.1 4-oxalocrotonate tautomerase family protein [Fictibacillus enclensis]